METAQPHENLNMIVKDVSSVLRKVPNYKAAGPDGIDGFCIKKITEHTCKNDGLSV